MMGQDPVDEVRKEYLFRHILESYGEDPNREGLLETPKRWRKSFNELLSGYEKDPLSVFTTFESSGYKDLVIVRDIPFYSLCEHHVLPFFGRVHIGYLPSDRIVGLSKFARLVEIFGQRLQVQERLTSQIADTIQLGLNPRATIVVCEAEHLCLTMRGVQKPGSTTVTSSLRGLAEGDIGLKQEFFMLLRGGRG